jgi:hypothetical protein
MKACCALALVLAFAGASDAAADKEALSRLAKTQSLKCEFGAGTSAEWKNGVLTLGTGRFGPPGPQSTIHYDGIDLTTRKARVVGTSGASDAVVLPSGVGITLVEQVPRGGVAVTTVYGSYDAKKSFPAVMTKHVDVLGPFPQQYYGSCVVWQ